MSSTTVFVSGVTGFVASNVVKQLLSNNYKVVGSVRSVAKGEQFKSDLKSINAKAENFKYEIVEELSTKGAFDQALQNNPEVSVFLHVASPFYFDVKDVKKELLDPAVEGTTNALNAIHTYGKNIKRVVVTSSYVAIGNWGPDAKPGSTVTEESWNPITWEQSLENPLNAYFGSKKFAEKAAWDFVKSKNPQFKLSVINPVYVFGPNAFSIKDKSKLNTSSEIINGLLKLKSDDDIPDYTGYFIDVRDVAKAQLVAFEKDEAINQRLLLAAGPFTNQKVVDIMKSDFKQLEKLPKVDESKFDDWKAKQLKIDNDKTRKILGFEFNSLKNCIDDTVAQILE